MTPAFDSVRLLERLSTLGAIGRGPDGRLVRLAASDEDRAARDLLCDWLHAAGLEVAVDRIGNIYGIHTPPGAAGPAVLIGSHIDSVIDAGIYDGCYGVLAGLGVIEALIAAAVPLRRPVAVAAFTNEEGVRFAPDMMGSLVAAGGLDLEAALRARGTDGTILGEELARIGYAGSRAPGFLDVAAYVELHIEQGPVLEAAGVSIGAVESLQGISWQKITIGGRANHAGTTPMEHRLDAGVAAASLIAFADALARRTPGAVATVGTLILSPGAINVIPSKAELTLDLRHPAAETFAAMEGEVATFLDGLRAQGHGIATERLARFEPVRFDPAIVGMIEAAAGARQLSCWRMTSGAGHDAQMMARVAPSAMIFVPSVGGISHNPAEFTHPADLAAGAAVLLDVVMDLAGRGADR